MQVDLFDLSLFCCRIGNTCVIPFPLFFLRSVIISTGKFFKRQGSIALHPDLFFSFAASFRSILDYFCAYLAKHNCISEFLSQKYVIWKKKSSKSESVWGRYRWFNISYFSEFRGCAEICENIAEPETMDRVPRFMFWLYLLMQSDTSGSRNRLQ